MDNFGRRSFLRLVGQFSAILCMGISQKRALAQTVGTTSKKRPRRITVEEHILSQEYRDFVKDSNQDLKGTVEGIDIRLKDMDEDGIDMQVLSWGGPTPEEFDLPDAIRWCREINNNLAELVNKYPHRFEAFCCIPWHDPTAAITELERAVKELGLKGIKMDNTVRGEYIDAKKYWPVLKKAEELRTPIFIHIGENPFSSVMEKYSGQSSGAVLETANMAFNPDLDVCNQGLRLINSGIFDECPKLKFILGHMGAGLPFWSKRFGRGKGKKTGSECIRENFYFATSGNLSYPALICCYLEAGAEHILFAVDYPPESQKKAVEFMEHAPISNSDKEKIYHLNAERLFGI